GAARRTVVDIGKALVKGDRAGPARRRLELIVEHEPGGGVAARQIGHVSRPRRRAGGADEADQNRIEPVSAHRTASLDDLDKDAPLLRNPALSRWAPDRRRSRNS